MKNLLTIAVLLLVFISTSSVLYTSVNAAEEPYLEDISSVYLTSQKLRSEDGSTLIPLGAIQGVNDVYYVTYEYELLIKDGTTLKSNVRNLNFINADVDSEIINELFNFEFSYEIVETVDYHEDLFGPGVEANRVLVTLQISMNEPATKDIFTQVAGQQLTFESFFYVS